MKEVPILFTPDMIQATLSGHKTTTHRTGGLGIINKCPDDWFLAGTAIAYPSGRISHFLMKRNGDGLSVAPVELRCPFGRVGDILWCRERWRASDFADSGYEYYATKKQTSPGGWFDAKHAEGVVLAKWRPSIHMPKAACRLRLLSEEVSLVRARDITNEIALTSGVVGRLPSKHVMYGLAGWRESECCISPVAAYMKYFRSLPGGEDAWHKNSWVWRIKYSVIQ